MKKILGGLLLFMLLPCCVLAGVSVNGTAGAVDTPSADVLRPGQFSFSYNHLKNETRYGLGTAIAPGLELSGLWTSGYNENHPWVGIKYALREEGILTPGIAVGAVDLAGVRERSAYLVASKGLPAGYRIHIGMGNGMYNGVFFSVEKQLFTDAYLAFPASTLVVEYNGRHMNYGIHTVLGEGIAVKYGWRSGVPFAGLFYYR